MSVWNDWFVSIPKHTIPTKGFLVLDKKKVLLVYPPNQLMEIETPRPDGSLGPLYLASALEKQGIPSDLLDASVGPPGVSLEKTFYRLVKQANGLIKIGMDFDEIAEYVVKGGYTFVGL